ncbi:MAG: alanine racemase [Proteobacteria bacterium]|nr:alanine racemase [Pseudomonadota bacterium]
MARDEERPRRWSRRRLLAGAAAVATVTAVAAVRRGDRGGRHSDYFLALSRALREAGIARPTLVIDRARLQANVDALRRTLAGSKLTTRVVVKSLPARSLLEEIANRIGTNRFMVFNGPMILEMVRWRPESDLLLGKPLSALEVADVQRQLASVAGAEPGPQWLVDTADRIRQYAAIARESGRRMRVNVEIDVGLHRGGFHGNDELAAALDLIKGSADLQFAGLMGYDPHVPRALSPSRAYDDVVRRYTAAVEIVRARFGSDVSQLTFNTAGSPTYALHVRDPVATEVAVGSAFVKPHDFDIGTLEHHVPAAFIATPVLKEMPRTQIPGLEALGGVMTFLDANSERAFFIHGGHWLAVPESPPGLEFNPLFGRSSNQEMLNGSRSVALAADDYVFFRPTQSESLFLQFGDLAVYEGSRITERWPTFPASA